MTVLVSDSFNRADNATTLGSTDSYNGGTSKPWQALLGTWGITSNQAYEKSGTSNGIAVVDSGQSDVTITCTVSQASTTSKIAFRVVDANDYWAWTPGTIFRQPWHAYSVSGDTWSNGDVIKIVLSGSTMNFYRNGTLITTITDSTYQTATLHGLSSNSNSNYFDNFIIEGSSGSSTTTYIGSGTATGKSSLTSNETLILSPTTYSENVDTTGFSSLTTTETIISNTGTSYSASGQSDGIANLTTTESIVNESHGQSDGTTTLTSSETKSYSANGNVNSTSTLSHVGNVIYVDFGSSNGQSNLTTTETFVQHGTTTYSGNGHSDGLSSVSSNDKVTYESSNNVHGQSTLTTDEHEFLSAQGSVNGISSATSTEQIIGHATNSYSGMGLSDGTSNVTSSDNKSYAATGHISGTSNTISHDNVVYFPTGTANGLVNVDTTERFVSVFEVIGIIELNGILQLELEFVGTYDLNIYQKGVV